MRIAVGTDIVEIGRLESIVQRFGTAFMDRSFTAAEQADCAGSGARLAGRWAAKESVLKALGRGMDQIPLTDIEVVRLPGGAPDVRLRGAAAAAAAAAGWTQHSLSISHERAYATAVVVAVCDHMAG